MFYIAYASHTLEQYEQDGKVKVRQIPCIMLRKAFNSTLRGALLSAMMRADRDENGKPIFYHAYPQGHPIYGR